MRRRSSSRIRVASVTPFATDGPIGNACAVYGGPTGRHRYTSPRRLATSASGPIHQGTPVPETVSSTGRVSSGAGIPSARRSSSETIPSSGWNVRDSYSVCHASARGPNSSVSVGSGPWIRAYPANLAAITSRQRRTVGFRSPSLSGMELLLGRQPLLDLDLSSGDVLGLDALQDALR